MLVFFLPGVLAASLPLFGGEDPVLGNPWHHEMITKEAADKVGFSDLAAKELAWHSDYVDSYLYNPLWWAPGGVQRLKASLASGPMLKTLHFDDLFSPEQGHTMWRRYTSGTLAGLIWAWQTDDVAAARNIVGASLHALEDFYSHSNWLDDPARRAVTYLKMPEAARRAVPLFTGSYELPDHRGILPHGKPGPLCALLLEIPQVMDIACHPASPLSNTSICKTYKACRDATVARPKTVLGIPVPNNVYYLTPAGMNLDNSWQSDIGVKVRGLTDISGQQMFETAVRLATQTAVQWLQLIELRLDEIGAGPFWDRVKTAAPVPGDKERQFEDFSRFPHMFLGVGPYPPAVAEPAGQWYLRVRILTAPGLGSGTDADIVAYAAGRRDVLDYMPKEIPGLAYNDFEAGDDQAYYIGPYPTLPTSLELENASTDTMDVVKALGTVFKETVKDVVKGVGQALFHLIGGPADLVANATQVWAPDQLSQLGDDPSPFTTLLDGRAEGRYRVTGSIERLRRVVVDNRSWSEYVVKLDTILCERESDFDRGTTDDEPFVLALLVNQAPGDVLKMRTSPFENVDAGEKRTIGYTFPVVRVPDEVGYLTLPIQVMESDEELGRHRDDALDTFARGVADGVADARLEFISRLGRAIAADWRVARVEVFAFSRGETVTAGPVYEGQLNRWVRGRQRVTLPLKLAEPVRVRGFR